jgi:DNA-directed RNA polymerase specialized sigma24 family protein
MKPTPFQNLHKRPRRESQSAVFVIEGRRLTYDEIAAHLGITPSAARGRMRRMRLAAGSITWPGLRAAG